jgi:2,4-didehydro-3-deoxy-L-rhamnonate hydrolase
MKLARLGPIGAERPVVVAGGAYYDLSGITADIDGGFVAGGGLDAARRSLEAGDLPEMRDAAQLRVGAPIARSSAVVCIGMNYAAHVAESGSAPPQYPFVYLKTPNTVVGPNDAVALPRGSVRTDWEVELGVVIGTRASYLPSPRALVELEIDGLGRQRQEMVEPAPV